MPRTPDKLITTRRIAEALITVINAEPGKGADPDRLYAALEEFITRDEFDALIRVLVNAERISERDGRLYRGRP